MGTKNQPAVFDCLGNAHPDEPLFILLGRDPTSAAVIVKWTHERVYCGKNKRGDEQIKEALQCAVAMREYAALKYPPHKRPREFPLNGMFDRIIDKKDFSGLNEENAASVAALMADGLKYRALMNW